MKRPVPKYFTIIVGFGVLALSANGQGTFQNLDFENPIPPLDANDPSGVPITNALPGWTGYIGASQIQRVFYNTISIGGAAISLHGPGSMFPVFQGSYTVGLQAQYPSGTPVSAIAQTGTLPAGVESIQFYSLADGLTVSFAGHSIPTFLLGSTPNYNIYGGDISAFANQTGELRFSGNDYLDNIVFSPQSIPEPGVVGLLALGSLLLGWRLQRRSRL